MPQYIQWELSTTDICQTCKKQIFVAKEVFDGIYIHQSSEIDMPTRVECFRGGITQKSILLNLNDSMQFTFMDGA